MKRVGRCLALFCLFAVLLSTTASANSAAPDYRVAVKVVHGPEEPYYLDLLEQADGGMEMVNREGLDQELLEALRDAAPEGWSPCTLSVSQWESNYSGDLAGENGVHVFHGWHTPRVFRILVVTKSGESWVSEPFERELMNSSVTVDWSRKTAKMPPAWMAYTLQFLSTLLPTLAVEGVMLAAFGLSCKRNWIVFLLVNLVTQGILSAFLSLVFVQGGFQWLPLYLIILFPAEFVIAAVEALIYRGKMRSPKNHRALLYGFAANAASYALGWITVGAMFAGLISIG